MKVLFLGGDKRQIPIITHLMSKGYSIDLVGYEKFACDKRFGKITLNEVNIRNYNVIIFPVSGVKEDRSIVSDYSNTKIILSDHFFDELESKSLVFTGVRTKTLDEMLKQTDSSIIALMEDDEVKRENSIPTTEGIIGDLVFNTDFTINGSSIFVLGYGNVGKTLTNKLQSLGAYVTVGVLTIDQFDELTKNKVSCLFTNDRRLMERVMEDSDVIINTVPELIINKDYLKVMNKDAYVLDISSSPYGVDFKAADELQIRNKLFSGIPSIVAPKTAGQILVNKIDSILERSKP